MRKLILAVALTVASSANAAIIDFQETTSTRLNSEYLITGENTHIDTTTGLEWLDFGTHDGNDVTFGHSIESALTTYTVDGFRLATETEVFDLFNFFYTDFGDTSNGDGSYTVGEDPSLEIIKERNSWLVGFGTHDQTSGSVYGDSLFSTGLYIDDDGSIQFAGFRIFLDEDGVETKFYSTDYTVSGLDRDTGYNQFGVFMVRDDRGLTPPEVPIPAAVWLFASGLLGLVAVGRRKA